MDIRVVRDIFSAGKDENTLLEIRPRFGESSRGGLKMGTLLLTSLLYYIVGAWCVITSQTANIRVVVMAYRYILPEGTALGISRGPAQVWGLVVGFVVVGFVVHTGRGCCILCSTGILYISMCHVNLGCRILDLVVLCHIWLRSLGWSSDLGIISRVSC